MTTNIAVKTCLACSREITGRADKKFCSISCRNKYNNRINSDASPLIRAINNTLRRNRRILQDILAGKGKSYTIPKDKLRAKGFLFKHFTHIYKNLKGEIYHYCYDYGYLYLEDQSKVLIVRDFKELSET